MKIPLFFLAFTLTLFTGHAFGETPKAKPSVALTPSEQKRLNAEAQKYVDRIGEDHKLSAADLKALRFSPAPLAAVVITGNEPSLFAARPTLDLRAQPTLFLAFAMLGDKCVDGMSLGYGPDGELTPDTLDVLYTRGRAYDVRELDIETSHLPKGAYWMIQVFLPEDNQMEFIAKSTPKEGVLVAALSDGSGFETARFLPQAEFLKRLRKALAKR